ncbi:SPFH domain-containing protein [Pseudobacteriovorax antillogorgiicola]|uniref:SPFH domain-containing protein n=1 Tax=Pseudobacteriovorax antillogorgiicola TaxID=1513793 RepID=UPI00399B53B3
MTFFTVITIIFLIFAYLTFVIVPMREAIVVERLGKFLKTGDPGLHILIPFFDRVSYRHETREQVLDIPPQSCISKDNIQIEVDGILYLQVIDPKSASYGIEDYRIAAINLAQTTMRSEIGKLSLGQTFSERDTLNEKIVQEIDKASSSWGIKVLRYEVMNIDPSDHVVNTLEKQMEAEREKRAEILLATAEKESTINLSEGDRQYAINISEGERQKRINEAEGRAKKIQIIAEATADGMKLLAEAMRRKGGQEAAQLRVVERYIDELGDIFKQSDISVLPREMAQVKGIFEGVDQIQNKLK